MDLPLLWFLLIAVLWTGYLVLEASEGDGTSDDRGILATDLAACRL